MTTQDETEDILANLRICEAEIEKNCLEITDTNNGAKAFVYSWGKQTGDRRIRHRLQRLKESLMETGEPYYDRLLSHVVDRPRVDQAAADQILALLHIQVESEFSLLVRDKASGSTAIVRENAILHFGEYTVMRRLNDLEELLKVEGKSLYEFLKGESSRSELQAFIDQLKIDANYR